MDVLILHTYSDSSCYEMYYETDDGIYGYCASPNDWEAFWKGDKELNEDTAYIFLTVGDNPNAFDGVGPFATLEEAIENA